MHTTSPITQKRWGFGIVGVVLAFTITSCGRRAPSQAEGAYRAFKQIEGATDSGISKTKYDELIQNAAGELLILSDLAKATSDSLPLQYYQAAIEIYKDASMLWADEISNARWSFVPAGKFMLNSGGLRVSQRYHLSIDTIKYFSGHSDNYKVTSKDAISELWQRAIKKAHAGDSLVIARRPKQ